MKYSVVEDLFLEDELRPKEQFERYVALAVEELTAFLGDPTDWDNVSCPACGCATAEEQFRRYLFTYRACERCGSLFVSPRPPMPALARYAQESRAEHYWRDEVVLRTAEGRTRHVSSPRMHWILDYAAGMQRDHLVCLCVGSSYDTLPSELSHHDCFDAVYSFGPLGRPRYETAEPSEHDLTSIKDLEQPIDVVAIFDTLEELYSPNQLIRTIRQAMSPHGLLLIATTSSDGFEIQMLRERARAMGLPHRLNLLSKQGVERLLGREGFVIRELSTPGQLDVGMVADERARDPTLHLPAFIDHIIDSGDPAVLDQLQRFLQVARLSSHMRVVAEVSA